MAKTKKVKRPLSKVATICWSIFGTEPRRPQRVSDVTPSVPHRAPVEREPVKQKLSDLSAKAARRAAR